MKRMLPKVVQNHHGISFYRILYEKRQAYDAIELLKLITREKLSAPMGSNSSLSTTRSYSIESPTPSAGPGAGAASAATNKDDSSTS